MRDCTELFSKLRKKIDSKKMFFFYYRPTLNEAKETSYVKKLNDFMKPRNLMRSEMVENMLETK